MHHFTHTHNLSLPVVHGIIASPWAPERRLRETNDGGTRVLPTFLNSKVNHQSSPVSHLRVRFGAASCRSDGCENDPMCHSVSGRSLTPAHRRTSLGGRKRMFTIPKQTKENQRRTIHKKQRTLQKKDSNADARTHARTHTHTHTMPSFLQRILKSISHAAATLPLGIRGLSVACTNTDMCHSFLPSLGKQSWLCITQH